MKAILIDDEVHVYGSMEDDSISIATLRKGEMMELGKVSQRKRKTWVEITLSGEQKGYIAGDTKIFAVRRASVASASADMKDAPGPDAKLLKTLVKGSILTVSGVEKNDDGTWYKVTDDAGVEGFIPSSSKLRVVPESTRSGATRNMVTGLIFVVIGILLTTSDFGSSSGNTMVMVSYAVIFFGLLQLGQGVFEYFRVRKDEANKK